MGHEILLDRQFDDGAELLRRLKAQQFDVTAAGWVRNDDGGLWRLHIASKNVDDQGLVEAYRQVQTLVRGTTDLRIELDDVKLISAVDPLAKKIAAFNNPLPTQIHIRHYLRELSPMRSGEAHVYPPIV